MHDHELDLAIDMEEMFKMADSLGKKVDAELKTQLDHMCVRNIGQAALCVNETDTGIAHKTLEATDENLIYGMQDFGTIATFNPLSFKLETKKVSEVSGLSTARAVRLGAQGLKLALADENNDILTSDWSGNQSAQRYHAPPFESGLISLGDDESPTESILGWGYKDFHYNFGFTPEDELIHLNEEGLVMKEDQPLSETQIKRTLWRKRIKKIIPARRIAAAGGKVLVEDVLLDEWQESDLYAQQHGTRFVFGSYWTCDNHDESWYYIRHRVGDVSDDDPMDQPKLSEKFHSKNSGFRATNEHRESPRMSIHPNGYMSSVTNHTRSPNDGWSWSPFYDCVNFFNPDGHLLGKVRVESNRLNDRAIAVSAEGKYGFIGKSDGTIERVALNGNNDGPQDSGSHLELVNHSRDANGNSTSLSFAMDNGGYWGDSRTNPIRALTYWRASKKGIGRVYALDADEKISRIATVDNDGKVKVWDVPNRLDESFPLQSTRKSMKERIIGTKTQD